MQDEFEKWRERTGQENIKVFESISLLQSRDWMQELRDHELIVRRLSKMLPFLPTPQTCAWKAGMELAKFNAGNTGYIAPRSVAECKEWAVELWEGVWQGCGADGMKMGEHLEAWQDKAIQLWKQADWIA